MTRSALETVTLYIEQIWNKGRDDLIPELCADPIMRHDPNALTILSHAEQKARIRHNYEELRPLFTWEVLAGDDRHITLVWNVTGRDPAWALCGIEIFRVEDGRITDVWNLPYVSGRWGQSTTLGASRANGLAEPMAVLGIEVADKGATIRAPVDAAHMQCWIEQLLGKPESRGRDDGLREHLFSCAGADADALTLLVSDADRAGVTLDPARVSRMALELGQNGLVDATITVSGEIRTSPDPIAPMPAPKATRLSRTVGSLERDGAEIGVVVDASIAFGVGGRDAEGRVAIRLADGVAAEAAAGEGALVLGWEEGGETLLFTASATLVPTARSFADETGAEAMFAWHAPSIEARLVSRASG